LQQTFSNSPTSFGYYFYQGTSMAAPHAAAAAALVIAKGAATTPSAVRARLESTADDLGSDGRDNSYGHGLLNLAAALANTETPTLDPEPEPTQNQAPEADAGDDQTVTDSDNTGSETITLNATDSSDADGTIEKYEWHEADTLLGNEATLSTELPVGVHTITLTVTDNHGVADSDTVTITVEAPATQPTTPEVEVLLSESFENSLNGWTQDSQADWRISTRKAYSGRQSVEIDGTTNNGTLISPLFNANDRNVRIGFSWLIEDNLDSGEYLAFDISTDGGKTWTEYRRLRADQDSEEVWLTNSLEFINVGSFRLRFRGQISSAVEDAYVDAILIETF
jgi:hypothetical protein